MAMKKLTDKWLRFVALYDGNLKNTAEKVGFHPSYVRRMISDPLIVAAIRDRENKELAPQIASRQERQAFWANVMYDENADMKDRLRASELLGKSEKDFVDRIEQSGPGGGPVQQQWTVRVVDKNDRQVKLKK